MEIFLNILLTIFAVVLFLLIILIHELGHFSAAKLSGIRVNKFAIGLGPNIFNFKKNETEYSLKLLPIGGFCEMGEDEESDDENSFCKKGVFARIITIAAGAVMNIILGFILSFIIVVQMPNFTTMKIKQFDDNAISNSSGLKIGDTIRSFNGYKTETSRDLSFALATSDTSKNTEVVVLRDDKEIFLKDVKFSSEKIENKEYIKHDFLLESTPKNFLNVFSQTFKEMVSNIRMVWGGLTKLIRGQLNFKELSGPVGIASGISKAASAGLKISFAKAINNIISFMILITVNLGIFNLLPLPALDGGRLVFLFIEAIIRKPIPVKYESLVHALGFIGLMLVMLILLFDVIKIFGHSA